MYQFFIIDSYLIDRKYENVEIIDKKIQFQNANSDVSMVQDNLKPHPSLQTPSLANSLERQPIMTRAR